MRRWIWGLAGYVCCHGAWAGSLSYCQGQVEPSAATQDRLIQVAAVVKNELDHSGQTLALVARSGLALQRFDHRYSHAGVSLKGSPNAPWSVRQLYYACDEQRPRIFDQGMSGFVLGANDPSEGYISLVLLPTDAALALEQAAMDADHAVKLLGNTYSANAYAFAQQYQNCNQWLIELIASAWGADLSADNARATAQLWLQTSGYVPSVVNVGWRPLVWLAGLLPWLHTDDHPETQLAASQFMVSMPQSIEAFVHHRFPEAKHIEICYTADHIVVHRGWDPIAPQCQAGPTDEISYLAASAK